MSFAVYACCSLLIGSLDKAEYLAITLIKPIFQVLDAVLFLCLYICLMRVRDSICSQTFDFVMNIHVKWHFISPLVTNCVYNRLYSRPHLEADHFATNVA